MAKNILKQRNTWMTIGITFAVVIVGLLLLIFGGSGETWFHLLCSQVGAALVVTAGLGGLWEWRGKRLLAEEVAGTLEAARALTNWGVRDLSMEWHGIPWPELFKKGPNVDLMIGYAQTWRNTTQSGLQGFLSNSRNRLRVCLPDPTQDWVMQALGQRFSQTADQVRHKIYEAAAYFAGLRDNGEADVKLYFREGEPTYALYRFESAAIVTMYPHGSERIPEIPTITVETGDFVNWLKSDFDAAIRCAREVSDDEIRNALEDQ